MIGKETQWVATINGDEIQSEELSSLLIYEEAGLQLPMLRLHFYTQDFDKVRRYSTPGYKIEIGFGRETIEEKCIFRTFSKKVAPMGGADNWSVLIHAVLANIDYLTKQRLETYKTWSNKKKSSEVFSQVMQRYGIEPLSKPSKDEMLWVQHNITDRQFLEEVVLHGYFADNDPTLSGIRRDMKAIYKPFSALKNPKGLVSNSPNADIIVDTFGISQNDGFFTGWSGFERRHPYHFLEEGVDEVDEGELVPLLTQITGVYNDVTRTNEIEFLCENVHKKWNDAYRINRQFRSSLSSTRGVFTIGEYYKIHILDCYVVNFQRQSDKIPIDPVGGKWLVTRTSMGIVEHAFYMKVTLCRESLQV